MTTSHGRPDEVDQALIAAGRKIKAGAPALNTVLLRLSVLSKLHTLRAKGQPNPCMDPHIRLLVQRAKSGYAQREQRLVNQKPALLQEHLDALLDTCKEDSLIDLRDRALLLLAWTSGGRRRSEVSRARMSQLKKHSKGYQLNIGVSKTNQTGEHRAGNLKPVIGQAAEALTRWLERSGVKSGPIFRRIRVHGGAEEVTVSPLTGHAIREIVMARAQTAGLGDAGFSAHSLRSGFVTTAADRNAPINIIMSLAGMADVKTVSRYFRSLDDRNEEALRKILGEEEPER
jgi:integrase